MPTHPSRGGDGRGAAVDGAADATDAHPSRGGGGGGGRIPRRDDDEEVRPVGWAPPPALRGSAGRGGRGGSTEEGGGDAREEETWEEDEWEEDAWDDRGSLPRSPTAGGGHRRIDGAGTLSAGPAAGPPPLSSPRYVPDTAESKPVAHLWKVLLPPSVSSSRAFELLYRAATSNAAPDDTCSAGDGPGSVRFAKFAGVTLGMICAVHPLVRWVGWVSDDDYALSDFLLYDLNYVMLDVISFFVVGRLYDRRGCDCLFPFILPMALGAVYPSWITDWAFLRHSFSLYEIRCAWPPQLFVYAGGLVLLAAAVVGLHVRHARGDGTLPRRLAELTALLAFFVLPYASHPNFHMHHWYYSWLVGMQLNMDAWWSKASLAYLWGQYVNGIAVWGRDPILTCAYGYYLSTDIRCPYMTCYRQEDGDATGGGDYLPFSAPDWRNCSAGANYAP